MFNKLNEWKENVEVYRDRIQSGEKRVVVGKKMAQIFFKIISIYVFLTVSGFVFLTIQGYF